MIGIIITFIIGYVFIIAEHNTRVNKATVALLMAVIAWLFLFVQGDHEQAVGYLMHNLAEISQVVFFLIGALTIVEVINAHRGFDLILPMLQFRSKRTFLWVIGGVAFFLSAVLDNLTTTVVMVALVRQLVENRDERWLIGGAVVIAANAGGAWTPIGDVTTTMLWIGGQLTTVGILRDLFLPSLVCAIVAIAWVSWQLKGEFPEAKKLEPHLAYGGKWVFALGLALLVFVPVLKTLTGLPPFMGMLFGLGVMWVATDILHGKEESRANLCVPQVFTHIDLSGTLFFLGVLLAVGALEVVGFLTLVSQWFSAHISQVEWIAVTIGLVSAIVDNVPLVAASMGMYDFPQDARFWELIAFAAGTGGSILIIGSAAGVVLMGLERVSFVWYLRRLGPAAFLGFAAGVATYLLVN